MPARTCIAASERRSRQRTAQRGECERTQGGAERRGGHSKSMREKREETAMRTVCLLA
jgi:hypothetical protein